MSRLRAVNGHGFTPSPHIDEQPRDYATLVADINERREAHEQRVKAWSRTVWITFAAAVVAPIVAALIVYLTLRA